MTTLLAGRYRLGPVIGTGAGSTVRSAYDETLGRNVAIKLLDDEVARTADPAGRDRFLAEARSLARVDHPHVVRVFDAGEDGGQLYLVMELIEGQTLAEFIAAHAPVEPEVAAELIGQVLTALAAVHAAGFVHRDVKPANVLLDDEQYVSLTDFGIAKELDQIESSLTAVGTVVGTPGYLAPEQAAGQAHGPWTDLYSTGLMLAELLGIDRHADHPTTPGVPDAMRQVIDHALARDPMARFRSADAMAGSLRAATRPPTAAMPAVDLPLEPTRVWAADERAGGIAHTSPAGSADRPTGIMVVSDRSAPFDSALFDHPPRRRPGDVHRASVLWVLGVAAVCVVLIAAISTGSAWTTLEDVPIPATTEMPGPTEIPATTVPEPSAATVAPTPEPTAAPVVADEPPAKTKVPGQPNGKPQNDKPPKADKP